MVLLEFFDLKNEDDQPLLTSGSIPLLSEVRAASHSRVPVRAELET